MLIEEYLHDIEVALKRYELYCKKNKITMPEHRCQDLEYFKELLKNKEMKILEIRKKFIKRYEEMTVNKIASIFGFYDLSALRYYLKGVLFSPKYSKQKLRNAYYNDFIDKFNSPENIPEAIQNKLTSLEKAIETESKANADLRSKITAYQKEERIMRDYIQDMQNILIQRNIQVTPYEDYKKCHPYFNETENNPLNRKQIELTLPSFSSNNAEDENSLKKELAELQITVQKLAVTVEELQNSNQELKKANDELVKQNMELISKNRNSTSSSKENTKIPIKQVSTQKMSQSSSIFTRFFKG